MKLTAKQIAKANNRAVRQAEIELGMNVNKHRVHKNKKAYDRKRDKQINY